MLLRILVAALGALLLTIPAGAGLWAARGEGDLSYEAASRDACWVRQDGASRHADCASLNALAAAPFLLLAGAGAIALAWRPERRALAIAAVGAALAGLAVALVANVGTPRRDWVLAALVGAMALGCALLVRSPRAVPRRAG